jgi:hypothetical protein
MDQGNRMQPWYTKCAEKTPRNIISHGPTQTHPDRIVVETELTDPAPDHDFDFDFDPKLAAS